MHLRFSTFGLTLNPQKFHTGGVDGNHPLLGKNHHWSTLIGLVDPEERSEVGRVSRHTQTTKQGQGGDLEFLPASFPLEIIVIKSASVLTCSLFGASLVAQMVKNLPAVQETRVRSLGGEDSLEKGMDTQSLAWRIPWTEKPAGLQPMGSQRVRHN